MPTLSGFRPSRVVPTTTTHKFTKKRNPGIDTTVKESLSYRYRYERLSNYYMFCNKTRVS
jgi:hypothetical protein